jgi:hypothetical protein
MLNVGEKEVRVSEIKHPSRMENSVALVETLVDHFFADHKSISLYGLKRRHGSYEVWVEHEKAIITVQSLTREIILHCTDPDEETAVKFQVFIERGIRQGMKAVITEGH